MQTCEYTATGAFCSVGIAQAAMSLIYLKRKTFSAIVRETSGKLLTKAYGIVHNVPRVSLNYSIINDKQVCQLIL